ncbi:hypothetical protein [Paramicrobacterium chengjingii]|uniref:Uncharacterized protein n=1 Tax=Paramicrobacterium chengjingii TaxID=2769067 RepID=A0ABX6YJH3_9MICO|nr:hypothetical protein [Microbacterium chengjingii]QPZ38907.1 hypothetical protein HCR76_02045 [Microbacterium chengjingii]
MSTSVQSPVQPVETSHPPSTRPPTESHPPQRTRRPRRTSWLSRLLTRLRRPRFEIDPHTAHQNERARVQREAANARALVYYGGFR